NGNVNTSNATSNTITDGTNTSTITAGKATIGSSIVDGVNNTFTTGGANAVKLDGAAGTIKTGTVTVTGGTTNDIIGLSNTTVTAADFATKGRAATEEQLKAVGEQTWQITADKDATTSGAQTGTKKDAKVGKDDKVQLIAGENLTVNQNERDFTYSLNKDLVKMNSATFEATGGRTTVIKGDSIVQTDGTKVNTSTAGGNTVADGTKSTETTAAGQVIKDGAKTNTSTVDENTLVDGAKSNKTTVDSNVIDDGNGNVNTSNTTSNTITDGTNTSTITAGKATIGSSIVDGVNNTFTTGGANAVKLDGAAGTIKTGTVTVTGGTTNDITGLSNTTVTSADFATKGRAATEEQLKAVGEQTWQITADKDATTSGAQTGTKKDAKVGKNDKVQLIAGENMTVNQNERDFTFTLNKDLVKMNSATFLGTGTNKTVITGDSITQTAGTQTNTSTAAGNTVVDGTKSTETTATGQVIKDGAKTNTSIVDENTLVDGTKSNKTTVDSNVIDDGNGNVNTSNATSNTITDGTNTSTVTAGKATIGSSIVDGINNTFTTGGANAVKLDGAAGTIKTGTVTVTGGTTNDITGLSNTTVTAADFATKGRAATEEQLKAVGEQTWQITADKDATTSGAQTGTKKDAKVGKDDKVQLIAGENMTVNQNERDFTFTLNKDLVKMNSATFLGTGTNKTVITGDSITQTAGTQMNTSTAAGNTVADGTKSTATTADGTTITNGANSTATTATGNTVTSANGNTKYASDGVRINTTGKNPVSLTDAGLDNGNNVIKNVASGHVNNDATDNTNAANIADVKKATTTVTANAGEAANATKGNVTLTSTTAADGHTIYDVKLNDKVILGTGANAVTIDGTAGKATIGSSIVDGINNTFTTGGANAVKLDGAAGTIKTGTVTVTGGTTNDITGLSNTTVTAADFATKGRAATEEQLKAVGEQTWQITADKDAATSGAQTGTKKDAKVGKDDKVQLIAGENLTVNQNERDFTYSLNKDLVKMNSATFEATGGKTTIIKGDSIVQTAGTQTNTSTAAGNTVADGTKSTETTAAGQVIKDGTKTNTSTVDENTLVDGTKSNKSTVDSNVIDDGNGNVNTSNATSNTITDGTNASTITAGKATIGTAVIDGVNNAITTGGTNSIKLDGAAGTVTGLTNKTWTPGVTKAVSGRAATEDQLQIVADKVGAGWNVNSGKVTGSTGEANGSAKTKISSGDEVQFQAGDNLIIDQNGKTLAYSLNKNLKNMESATFNATGGKTTVIKGDSIVQTDGANTNTSTATSNTLKNAAGDETKVDAKGATVKDAAGNTTNVASTGATVTNAAGDTTKVEATGTTVTDTAGNKATFTKDGVTITKPGKDTVSLTGSGLDNGNNKIVNVADGTAAKDAVNVSQLDAKTKAATTELTANGGQGANNTTTGNIVLTKTTAADGHTIYDNKLNDKITLGAADPTKAITVDGIAGTITAGKDGNAVAINGTNGTVKAGDGKNAVAIDGVNGSVKVADKITLNGKDGKAGIGTVGIDGKDGIITTGGTNPIAVNGKDGVVTGLTNKAWDPNNITSGRAATEDQIKSAVANAGWNAAVGSEGSGVNSTPTATAEKIKPNETVTFKAGNNMMVSQVGKTISYAVNPELTDMKSATFKDAAGNTTVTNGNGMTITPGSANPNNPNAGPVSLTKDGLHNGNNQIKGVAPGTDPTDAVNVSQLNASNANTSQAINQVAGEVQRVGAHAAAMAALKPIQYDPLEPTQVMAGVGNYRGETAAALGLAHYTNENTMFNIGVSVGGNHNMVNAGVTHKFGYSPEKKNIPDRYKAGPISSVYVMQDEVSSLKKENAEQKYVIADQAARLNSLEAENERQRRELAETKQGLDDLRAAVDKLLASKG
ncbi:YadA-like family protein, partial [Veillonella sp.]|uniref:YadA-like family protein n=1 Tax=Veillonella sp. TaxID=1926307 RepID=UPI002931250F